jgi:hypothetical protein
LAARKILQDQEEILIMHPDIDKQRLLDLIQAEYEFVERTLEALTQEQMHVADVEGWWSVKDTVAHLSLWMRRLLAWFAASQQCIRNIPPQEGYTWKEIDRFNDDMSAADKDRALDDVLSEFHNVYAQVLTMVEGLPEEELFNDDFADGFDDLPWQLIVYNTYEHFHEHIKSVREWIGKL